jgi:hypothetical protein
VIKVDLDASWLAPTEELSGVVSVFLGMRKGVGLLALSEHPVTAVLRAAAAQRLAVGEAQLPVPPPAGSYADLLWARVQIGLRDDDMHRLTPILQDIMRLTTEPGKQSALDGPDTAPPVIGVQTVSEGIARILNPRSAVANPDPAAEPEQGAGRIVRARDLDVVAASGLDRIESPAARTWRVMAICADWRMGIESTVLNRLDPGLQLAALTSATLFGKAVLLLLGHQPDGPRCQGASQPTPAAGGRITVYLDEWQSRTDLGADLAAASEYPMLRVHMRTPDRPGATLEILESLRTTLKEMAPGSLGERDWNVRYARAVVASGNVALIQLTAQLAVNPETTPTAGKPVSQWGQAEFSMVERHALARAAQMSATPGPLVNDTNLPENTVISVGLMKMADPDPDPDPAAAGARILESQPIVPPVRPIRK